MDGWAHEISAEGGIPHRHPLISLTQRPLRFIQSVQDKSQIEIVAAYCREIAPNAILVNQQYDEDGLDYLMGAIKADISTVGAVMHMPMTEFKNSRPLGRMRGHLMSKWYRRNSYRLIFVSEGAQTEFESYYDAPRPTYVVNNGIPFDSTQLLNEERRIFPRDIPVIGFVGQFVQQKNIECLVHAWLETKRNGVDSRLLLVGDGPERANLERILRHSAPPGSWFITGWTKSPQEHICEMDLFVLTSHYEGLPLSLLEAAGRGIPALVAPFNGALDVSRQASWVKVAPGNSAKEIADIMKSILNDLPALKASAIAGLEEFRCYFSVKRMAAEVLANLGFEVN
jgi:glycosyltransferase involved in cell wall biosynthesis